MPKVILERHGCAFLLRTKQVFACGVDRDSQDWEPAAPMSILYQTDYSFPGLANLLGHNVCCCGATDGTVPCPDHGTSAGSMIEAASDWLCANEGEFGGRIGADACEVLQSYGEWGN